MLERCEWQFSGVFIVNVNLEHRSITLSVSLNTPNTDIFHAVMISRMSLSEVTV